MPSLLIAGAVAAIYFYLKGSKSPLPAALFAAGKGTGITTGFNPPATTSSPAGLTNSNVVTNQPGTSGSGVPSTALPNAPFQNTQPGFNVTPGTSLRLPFRAGKLNNNFRMRPQATNSAPSGSGCGCGGCGGCSQKKTCGGPHADGRGSCMQSSTPPAGVATGRPGTLPMEASFFNVFQTNLNLLEEMNGGTPAGQTYTN